MRWTTATFELHKPIPQFGALPGDFVLLRVGHPSRPVILQRNLELADMTLLGDPEVATLLRRDPLSTPCERLGFCPVRERPQIRVL